MRCINQVFFMKVQQLESLIDQNAIHLFYTKSTLRIRSLTNNKIVFFITRRQFNRYFLKRLKKPKTNMNYQNICFF